MTRRDLFRLIAGAPALAVLPALALPAKRLTRRCPPVLSDFEISQVVEDALRFLGVLATGETACANDLAWGGRLVRQRLEAIDVPREKQLKWPLTFQRALTWTLANEIAPQFLPSRKYESIHAYTAHMAYASGREFSLLN